MKMIVHLRQEQVRLTIDKTQTIPVMAIIVETSEELSHFKSNQSNSCLVELIMLALQFYNPYGGSLADNINILRNN